MLAEKDLPDVFQNIVLRVLPACPLHVGTSSSVKRGWESPTAVAASPRAGCAFRSLLRCCLELRLLSTPRPGLLLILLALQILTKGKQPDLAVRHFTPEAPQGVGGRGGQPTIRGTPGLRWRPFMYRSARGHKSSCAGHGSPQEGQQGTGKPGTVIGYSRGRLPTRRSALTSASTARATSTSSASFMQ